MKTFDRHLLREWLQIFGLVVVAICGLAMMQVLYDDLRDLREHGARGWMLIKYVGITLPTFLPIALPLSLLISLLFTLGKLHRANELTAMRAAGVGFFRLMMPVWAVGILCCGLAWWLNSTIVPWSVERSASMKDEVRFQRDTKSLQADLVGAILRVAFDNRQDGRMWFFNRYAQTVKDGQYERHGYGVSVSQLDPQRRELTRLLAAEAWYDPVRKGWMFRNGRELTFDPEKGTQETSVPFREKFVGNYQEDPNLMALVGRRPIDLSLHQLRDLKDYLEAQRNPQAVNYAVRYYGLIAATLGPLVMIAMAIPFAVSGVRTNPAVGASKSLGLFALYYVLDGMASSLATKGLADPQFAAWLPNLFLAALSLLLFLRLR